MQELNPEFLTGGEELCQGGQGQPQERKNHSAGSGSGFIQPQTAPPARGGHWWQSEKTTRPGQHAVWSFPNLPCLLPEDKPPHGHGCQEPAALHSRVSTALSPSWALPTNTCTGSLPPKHLHGKQLDLHFVQHTFHSTLHSHHPFITANQQDNHPRQSDFHKAKELETR